MRIVNASVLLPAGQLDGSLLKRLERYARVCYKSEEKMQDASHEHFLQHILNSGHESVIEHEKVTLMMVTDRGVTHEVVRHRLGSYSQESTRYCNYYKDKFNQEITVIKPCFYEPDDPRYSLWEQSCAQAEENYFALLKLGATPQEARSVLPNSLKTELVVTYNLRQWRHFLSLRAARAAHPQAREIAIPILKHFQESLPDLFADIDYDVSFDPNRWASLVVTDDMFEPLI